MPLKTLQQNMYSPITSRLSIFYKQTSTTDILFITPEKRLHMFIICHLFNAWR